MKRDHGNLKIKILGSGQDAGIPHTGCFCEICDKARKHEKFKRLGPSIAIYDKDEDYCYLIDASPDFKYQLDMILEEGIKVKRKGKIPINGILLTHAHLGHCSGLWYLGKEAVDEKNVPIFCTQNMKMFLTENYPFSHLVQRKNIIVQEIQKNKELGLDGIKYIPIEVPHRNEIADTVGYIIQSKRRFIYLPDIDYWTEALIKEIQMSDIALVDGTFYSKDELEGYSEVPHPPILETIEILGDVNTKIYFTHINHTNAINKNGEERKNLESKGFKIAYDGMTLTI